MKQPGLLLLYYKDWSKVWTLTEGIKTADKHTLNYVVSHITDALSF